MVLLVALCSTAANIGVPGPAPPVLPAGRGPGPLAPCAALAGLCAGLLRCARARPPPPGLGPPAASAASLRSAGGGPPLAVRGFGPRPGPWVRSAPLRFVPRSAGLGLSARALARRSGPLPPRRRAAPPLRPSGSGRRARFRPPRASPRLALRPRGLPGSALLRCGRGWVRCAAGRWRVPPFRPAPAGRLRPRSSAPGAARRPAGGFLAAFAAPGAYVRFFRRLSRSFNFRSKRTSAIA